MLRLTFLFFLFAVVQGRELECDEVDYYEDCWSSITHSNYYCWRCEIKDQHISEIDQTITIHGKFANGTVANVELVEFNGGSFTKMPKIFQKTSNQQIEQVSLWFTETHSLDSKFFRNSGDNLKYFWSYWNKLSVEGSEFNTWTNLEALELVKNGISSIPNATFRGLHKLIKLNLGYNNLSMVLEDWFLELDNLEDLNLQYNQLETIPDNSFKTLTKLKR